MVEDSPYITDSVGKGRGAPKRSGSSNLLLIAAIIIVFAGIAYVYLAEPNAPPEVSPSSTSTTLKQPFIITTNQVKESYPAFFRHIRSGANDLNDFSIENCSAGICNRVNMSRDYDTSLAWSLLGYIGLYKASGDPDYLSSLNDTMHELMDVCSNRIEACNVRAGENPVSEINSSVKYYCDYVLVQSYYAYKLTRDENFLGFMKDLGICHGEPWAHNSDVMLESIGSREQFILYGLAKTVPGFRGLGTKEMPGEGRVYDYEEFRRQATERLNRAIQNYPATPLIYSSDGADFRVDACWLQLAKLSGYETTGDQSYFQDVDDFFSRVKLGGNIGNHSVDLAASSVLPCLESLQMMKEMTNSTKYDGDIVAIDDYLVNHHLDFPERRLYNGNFGLSSVSNGGLVAETVKPVSDNAHFIYLLSLHGSSDITVDKP
jgi:hypothetical protein